jgi:hypothetical protein
VAAFSSGTSDQPGNEPAQSEIGPERFLARVEELVDWEALAPTIDAIGSRAGRKLPLSAIRIALLKQWYELADTSAEFTILDRLSFRDFVGFRGDGSSSDVETLNELRESSWSGLRELRPVLEIVDQQLRDRGFNVQPGYIVEATIVPSTDGELREIDSSVTAVPSPGELGRMVEAVTAKAHAQGRMPTGPQPVPDAANESELGEDAASAGEEQNVGGGRVRAQLQWPWGQRSELIDILQVGRDYAFSPFARELTPYTHVSRRHAELLVHGDSVWIRDLGSRNGTFVNNEEVPRGQAFLIDADAIVRFGPLLAVSLTIVE